MAAKLLLVYMLIKTNRCLTFDIVYQHPDTIHAMDGGDNSHLNIHDQTTGVHIESYDQLAIGKYFLNLRGYHDMGPKAQMLPMSDYAYFDDNNERDEGFNRLQNALLKWAFHFNGRVERVLAEMPMERNLIDEIKESPLMIMKAPE